MHNFDMPKFKEGGILQGFFVNLKLLSDLILGGSVDLKSDLRGQLRSLRPKMSFFLTFQFDYFDNTTFHTRLPLTLTTPCRGR